MHTAERIASRSSQTASPLRAVRTESHATSAPPVAMGNQAVQRLLIQAKLPGNQPGDSFEPEADRVAELTGHGDGPMLLSAATPSRSAVGSLQRLYGNQSALQMRHGSGGRPAPAVPLRPSQSGILQRKCACGSSAGMSGECEECSKKQQLGLQTKLKVNEPGDIYEQEADWVSEQVMHMPELQVQCACACGGACPNCQMEQPDQEHESLQTKHVGSGDLGQTAEPSIVDDVLSSPGQPLDTATRSLMEPRFGHDFSGVRVHTDTKAMEAAQAIHALAYTVGRDVVFGAGQYVPSTPTGQRLLAHELTHVIQQRAAPNIARAPADRGVAGAGITTPAKQSEVSRKGEPGFGNKPRALTPAEVKKSKQWEEGIDAALDVLTPHIHVRGHAFLDQWLTQMINAKSDAQPPVEEEKDYWVIALLGNLLWAASVFVPGAGVIKGAAAGMGSFKAGAEAFRAAGQSGVANQTAIATGIAVEKVAEAGMTNLGKAMYATMAMGGSLAASGIVQRWATDPSGDPTGKEVVAFVLNTKRKEMGKALERHEEHLAYDLVLNGFTFDRFQKGRTQYMIAVEEALWASLFPSIPKDELNAIYTSGLNAINGALADFKKQYRVWRENIQRCTDRFFVPMTQIPHTEDWPEEITSGREQPLDYCRRRLPFKPELDF